jgi:hypothetical protein
MVVTRLFVLSLNSQGVAAGRRTGSAGMSHHAWRMGFIAGKNLKSGSVLACQLHCVPLGTLSGCGGAKL